MSFSKTLKEIVDGIEGARAAVILGIDGIAIERYVREPDPALDIDLIATEFTTLLRKSAKTAEDTDLGDLREMVLATEGLTLLLRPITNDYFMLLAMNANGNVGRARFILRRAQLSLVGEFAI